MTSEMIPNSAEVLVELEESGLLMVSGYFGFSTK